MREDASTSAPADQRPADERPNTERPEAQGEPPTEAPGSPSGAVLITTFLVGVILVLWFGTYFLNIARG